MMGPKQGLLGKKAFSAPIIIKHFAWPHQVGLKNKISQDIELAFKKKFGEIE